MNHRIVIYILGKVMIFLSLFMLLPCIVAVIYGESLGIFFLMTAAITALTGIVLSFKKPKYKSFYAREGFVVVALSWIILSFVGCIPFYISGEIPRFIDAMFEMVSGFTTTGASILPRVEELSKCMLFWRSFSHWIGGMGVLVFILAILPMAEASNMHLLRAESSGPSVGKLVPKMKQTAIILYGIYMSMTVLMILLLALTGMPLFDNICLTFGTAGTGGFGLLSDSIAGCSAVQQWIITVFMVLFGVNFSFYYLILFRKMRQAFKMEEVRWYFIVYLSVVVLIAISIFEKGMAVEETIRISAFQVASIMTTTGFSTVDFELWPAFSKGLLVLIMFVGACAGSTGGGIKISRFVIGAKSIAKELKNLIYPQRIKITKIDGKPLSDNALRSVGVYFLLYATIFVLSMIIISFENYGFETNFTAVAATLNNIGPGLADVGPTDNFASFSVLSKIVFMFDMLVGRLEIFPMMLLIMPSTWMNK